MGIEQVELALLKSDPARGFADARGLQGYLRTVAMSELALRSGKTGLLDAAREGADELEAHFPGLLAQLDGFRTDKRAGVAIEEIRRAAAAHLDPAFDAYLRGMALEGLVMHNQVELARGVALSEKGEVSARFGLRWALSSAKTLLALDQSDRALLAVDRFLDELPQARAPLLHLRGLILRQLGRLDEAALSLLGAIEDDPTFVAPLWALHFIVSKGVCVEECIRIVSEARARNPDEPMLTRMLGDAYTARGDVATAIPLLVECSRVKTIATRPRLAHLDWPAEPVKKPDFIIIGTPKSGTTSAYAYLGAHPDVLLATIKEISFFREDSKYALGIDWYLSHFPSVAGRDGLVTGEASPGYFYSFKARKRIAEHFPDTKLILFLRNPTARAISGYYQRKKMNGNIPEIGEYFATQFEKQRGLPAWKVAKGNGALAGGVYHPTVRQWHASFPKESLLIVRAEDLFTEPAEVMAQVFRHIGVEPVKNARYPVVNKGLYPQADEGLIRRMDEFYKPFNEALYEMIVRDMKW